MNTEVEGLHYSDEALEVRPVFLGNLNDVNIFVEDEYKEFVYEAIFERMFSTTLTIFCIFPLGGKDAVIRRAAENGAKDENGKPNVYIVDGDFDNIWRERKCNYPGLIYLNRYNIESYFLSEESTIVFLRGRFRRRRQDIIDTLQFGFWKQNYAQGLFNLFVLFACANKHVPEIPTVSDCTGKYLSPEGRVREEKVEELATLLSEPENRLLLTETEVQIRTMVDELNEAALSIVCGKCLIECLCRYIKQKFGKNIERESFRYYLMTTFDINKLEYLKEYILNSVLP